MLRPLSDVIPGLVPGIHVGTLPSLHRIELANGTTWMAGTSPAMTVKGCGRRLAERGPR